MKNDFVTKKAACILVIGNDGKVLTASRRGDFDDIGLPGGKVDPGEESWEAAIREFKEEVGVMLTKNDISKIFVRNCISEVDNYETDCFLCETQNLDYPLDVKTPLEVEKGIQIRWSTWNELLDAKNSFAEYNKMLYNHYVENI